MKPTPASALSIAICCLVSVWITNLPAVAVLAPTYAVFLFWASYYAAGSGKKGFVSSIVNNVVGAVWGFVALAVILPLLSFAGQFALPISIFIIGGAILLLSPIPIFGFVPGCFFGCATDFAITNSANIGPKGYGAILLATIIAAVLGNVFGVLADLLTKVFLKKEK